MPDRLSICAYPPKIAENGMQIMFPVAYFMFKREPILWYHPYMLEKDILLIINPNASAEEYEAARTELRRAEIDKVLDFIAE